MSILRYKKYKVKTKELTIFIYYTPGYHTLVKSN